MNKTIDNAILVFAVLLSLTLFKLMSDVTKLNTKSNIERMLSNGN